MIILKAQEFRNAQKLVLFINEKKIGKESILKITVEGASHYTLFYYEEE